MNYFTPDLVERFGSDDDAVADQGQSDWERASQAYADHYQSIQESLPANLRGVLDRFYLHDARIFGMLLDSPFLFLTMQLDPPPHEMLVLQYHVLKQPEIFRHMQGTDACPYLEWLYDEIDLKKAGDIVFFEHAILMTNGIELRIPFLEFDCLALPPPSLENGLPGPSILPQANGRPLFIGGGKSAMGVRNLTEPTSSSV